MIISFVGLVNSKQDTENNGGIKMLMIADIAKVLLRNETPLFIYNVNDLPPNEDYIYRMAPPIKEKSQEGRVWLPNISVRDSHEYQRSIQKWVPGILLMEQLLKERGFTTGDTKKDKYIDQIHTILHEEGHWIYFLDNYHHKGLDGNAYMEQYDAYSMDLNLKKIKDSGDIELLQKTYREHPFEKYADEYAFEKMKHLPLYELLEGV